MPRLLDIFLPLSSRTRPWMNTVWKGGFLVCSQAEKIIRAYREQSAAGVGVFTVDGKMIDIAFIPGAERTLKLARACGMYEGDLV